MYQSATRFFNLIDKFFLETDHDRNIRLKAKAETSPVVSKILSYM